MKSPKVILIAAIVVLLFGSIAFNLIKSNIKQSEVSFPGGYTPSVLIGDNRIYLEIAQTNEQKARGLSERENLSDDRGMLFVFSTKGIYKFWMKDMKFNLDFIYLNDEVIVETVSNVPYPKEGEEPQYIVVSNAFDKVIEVNAGVVSKLGIKKGDKVKFEHIND